MARMLAVIEFRALPGNRARSRFREWKRLGPVKGGRLTESEPMPVLGVWARFEALRDFGSTQWEYRFVPVVVQE